MTGFRGISYGWRAAVGAAVAAVGRLLDPRRPARRVLFAGLVGVVLLVAGFAVVCGDVGDGDGLAAYDRSVLGWLTGQRGDDLTIVVRLVTALGAAVSAIVLGGVGALLGVLRTRRAWPLVLVTVALCGAGLSIVLVKQLVGRVRPPGVTALVGETGWSFPSGHTLGATVTFGVLGYLGVRLVRAWWHRVWIVGVATVMIVAVGVSRMYLGVHWLTDVVGGWLLGAAWLVACLTVCQLLTADRSDR
ncbi:MAG: phosphatase PAP2 family protein [Streptosporangiales bacterium]|nr:phosphatase PAP2 family protein [Streptosporangiales bacterium]